MAPATGGATLAGMNRKSACCPASSATFFASTTCRLALCTETAQEYSPKVAFDGANYVAAWADYRYGSSWDVFATQVTSAGTVITPSGFSIVSSVRESEPFVSVASAGGQQSLAIYSRYDTEPNQGSRRVRGSFVSF